MSTVVFTIRFFSGASSRSPSLWPLFLIWTAITAAIWICGFGEADLAPAVQNVGLREALRFLLRIVDPIWLLLAAANVYASLAATEGLDVARRWAALLLGVSFFTAAASALFALPLGPLHYTTRLGLKLGVVPLAMPLLFFVVIIGARDALVRFFPTCEPPPDYAGHRLRRPPHRS
jgi:hypothetical protein